MVKYLKILAKSVLYGLLGFFLLVFTFILLLRSPANQTLLAQYFSPKIEKAIGYPLTLQGIQIKFFDELSLKGLRVQDPWGKEMIYIEKLDINFSVSDLFLQPGRPTMDYARLYQPRVHLVLEKTHGTVNLNHFIDQIIKWVNRNSTGPQTGSSVFVIKEAEVVDGTFSLDDEQVKNTASPQHFDLSHFEIAHINSKVQQFYTKGDTIGLRTIGFNAIAPQTNLRIKRLDTQFMISDKQMRFDQLGLRINDSWISDRFVVNYKKIDDLTQWITRANMQAHLVNSRLSSEDVSKFIEAMKPYKGIYRLNGLLAGTVNNLNLRQFALGFGQLERKGVFAIQDLGSVFLMDCNRRFSCGGAKIQR
jgi:hypothetical protein